MSSNYLNALVKRHDASGLSPEQVAESLIDPQNQSPKYARAVVYFMCAGILVAGILNILSLLVRARAGTSVSRSSFSRRTIAFVRYLSTSQPRAVGFIRFPSWAALAVCIAFTAFVGIWTFAQQPLYFSSWAVGSPPLAIRSGLFAVGCLPFIVAFGQGEIVSFVTGYSHVKLQVVHQWLSHLFLVLALLHTFPFIVAGRVERTNADGLNPDGLSELAHSWFVRNLVYYWSGVATLVPLLVFCWGKLGFVQRRWSAITKALNMVSGLLFTVFLYIHTNNLLTSWHVDGRNIQHCTSLTLNCVYRSYIYATAGIYASSILFRFAVLLVRNSFAIPRASIEPLANGAVRVIVEPASSQRWTAGQHYNVNFCRASPFQSVPLVVANVVSEENRTMTFILPSTSPLAPRLLKLASSTTSVLLDRPYGGPGSVEFGAYSSVVLLAGGEGISFVLATLEDLVRKMKAGQCQTKKVQVTWAVKSEASQLWIEDQLAAIVADAPANSLDLKLYITGSSAQVLGKDEYAEKTESLSSSSSFDGSSFKSKLSLWTVNEGRPALGAALIEHFATVEDGSTVAVACCGPHSFTLDVRRAVAKRQKAIAFGAIGGAAEIELVTEEKGW